MPRGSHIFLTHTDDASIFKRDIGKIPVIQLDSTRLTSEGFKGLDTAEFLEPLFRESVNGIGIVVLDEMDKKLMPQHASGGENVNSSIQSQLLTVMEGIKLSDRKGEKYVDTNNTLFIAVGAFQDIRDEKLKELKNNDTWDLFEAEAFDSDDLENVEITTDDIIKHGGLAEFMGRFSTVINFRKLDYDSVAIIVDRYAKDFEKQLGYPITITAAALDELFYLYQNSRLGCRVLKSAMWNKLSMVGIQIELDCIEKEDYYIRIEYGANDATYKLRKKRKKWA